MPPENRPNYTFRNGLTVSQGTRIRPFRIHQIAFGAEMDGIPLFSDFDSQRFIFNDTASEQEVTQKIVAMLERIEEALLQKVNDCLQR